MGLKVANVASVPTKVSALASVKWDLVLTAKEIRIQKEAEKSGSVCSVLTGGSVKFDKDVCCSMCFPIRCHTKRKMQLNEGFLSNVHRPARPSLAATGQGLSTFSISME